MDKRLIKKWQIEKLKRNLYLNINYTKYNFEI